MLFYCSAFVSLNKNTPIKFRSGMQHFAFEFIISLTEIVPDGVLKTHSKSNSQQFLRYRSTFTIELNVKMINIARNLLSTCNCNILIGIQLTLSNQNVFSLSLNITMRAISHKLIYIYLRVSVSHIQVKQILVLPLNSRIYVIRTHNVLVQQPIPRIHIYDQIATRELRIYKKYRVCSIELYNAFTSVRKAHVLYELLYTLLDNVK